MPKKIEKALRKVAAKKGYSKKRADAFVFGTLRHKFGWKPKPEK